MSGHSKWSSIKHKKAATDAKRGQLFTKIARDITMAAQNGQDPNPETNPPLRLAMQKAKSANMPNDNVDRAIKRAFGPGDGESLVEVTYEGYGPGGCAVLVDAVTTNRNRTVAEVRHAFSRTGGSMAESGSVAWQFERRGVISLDKSVIDEEDLSLTAIDAGALDIEDAGSMIDVITEPTDLIDIKDELEDKGFSIANADSLQVAKQRVALSDSDGRTVLRLFDLLDDLDDVARVHSNADFSDSLFDELD
jgi:YebC/PmpR family DNA-binding regulatory protein